MLENVKNSIHDVTTQTFEAFFDEYVMSVQDFNLITEIQHNVRKNDSDIMNIERLANEQHERLVK